MLASFICFSACTEEKLMEEPSVSTSQLQIVLSSSAVITKSGADTKVLAMEEELLINNCVLYIKDVTADKWFEPQYISNLSPDEADSEHQAYNATTVSGLTNGHQLEVMVIANISESNKETYLNCKDKTALEVIIEGTEEYAFKSDHLLKYSGVISHTVSADKNSLLIPLDILAARIEFVINVEQDENLNFIRTYYEDLSDLDIDSTYTKEQVKGKFDGAVICNTLDELKSKLGVNSNDEIKLYYGDRPITYPNGNGIKSVYIPSSKAVKVDEFEGKALEINAIYVKNIRTQVVACLSSNEHNMYSMPTYDGVKLNSFQKYSFYTYEKGENSSAHLEVEFSGNVKKTIIKKKTPVTASWVAFAENNQSKIWGTSGKEPAKVESGWGSAGYIFFTMRNWVLDPSYDIPDFKQTIADLGQYNNSFTIKGNSKKIEYGHLYNVTATIKDFAPQSTGKLDVAIKDYNYVEVPKFEFN